MPPPATRGRQKQTLTVPLENLTLQWFSGPFGPGPQTPATLQPYTRSSDGDPHQPSA